MDTLREQIGPLLGETSRLWRICLDERLRDLGLSQARWQVLLHLYKRGDGVVQKSLAEWLGVEGPTVVRLLDRMTEDGWIVRRESHTDRRAKTVHLTEKAQKIISRINEVARGLRRELLQDISPADLETCLRILQHIKHKAENLKGFGERSQIL